MRAISILSMDGARVRRFASFVTALVLGVGVLRSGAALAQTGGAAGNGGGQGAEATGVAKPVGRAEAPVAGLVRRDGETVAVMLPGGVGVAKAGELLLHGFSFNGEVVPTSKLHLRQLAPGVMEITSLAYSVGEWQFSLHDEANIYGLGERFDRLNHARQVVRNVSQDNGGAKGSAAYKPMPFYMSTKGYGLWVDTTAEAEFDFGVSVKGEIVVTVPADKLRVVVFLGPEFPGILEQFTGLVAGGAGAPRAVVPPMWAFAPWMGRDFDLSQAEVEGDVDRMRALGLPASVLLIDSPWATTYNSYLWNPKQFADAAGMVKHVHGAGYKLVLWHTPWINNKSNTNEGGFEGKIAAHSELYDEAAERGYFVKNTEGKPYLGLWWKGQGSLIDFTNPAAKQWWQGKLRGAMEAGADGFKDDDAEGNFQSAGVTPQAVKFADGTDPLLMRGRYSVLYNNAVEELIQKDRKGNGVVFARSVTQGANGLGFLWAGDNESSFSPENGLPTVVTAALNAGMSGMPMWGCDLGGYIKTATTPDGAPSAAVAERWTEFSAFSPMMEVFSQANTMPWDWDRGHGTAALDVYRKYAVLHMSLFPYRYGAAMEAAKSGMPLMRSLALVYQNDSAAREARDEYLFGPDFLVAPVVDENTRRPVYFPAGSWVDYWTGAVVTGGQTAVVDAPLDRLPVWVRAGAVVPKIPDDVMTLVPSAESGNAAVKGLDDRRVYELTGAATGDARMVDFEGRTVVRSGSTLKITGNKAARVTVRWRFARVGGVMVNGAAAKVVAGADGSSSVEFEFAKQAAVSWQ